MSRSFQFCGKLLFLHVNLAVLSVRRLGPCWSQNHEQHQLDVPKFQNTEDQECPVRSTCLLHIHAPRVSPVLRPNGITATNSFLAKQPTFTTYQSFTNKMVLHGSCQQFNPSTFRPQPLYSDVSHTPWHLPAVSAHQQCHGILNAGPPWQIGKTTGIMFMFQNLTLWCNCLLQILSTYKAFT